MRLSRMFAVLMCLAVAGCGRVPPGENGPEPDFQYSATPGAVGLVAGSSSKFSIKVDDVVVAASSYKVQISQVPSGLTVSPMTATLTPGTPASFTVSTPASSYTLGDSVYVTVTEQGGNKESQGGYVEVDVSGLEDPFFDFSVLPTQAPGIVLPAGSPGSAFEMEEINPNRLAGNTTLSYSAFPTGVKSTAPLPTTIQPNTPLLVTLAAAANAPAMISNVTVTATNGPFSVSEPVSVTVYSAPSTTNFALSTSYAQMVLTPGTQRNDLVVSLTPYHGFSGDVVVSQIQNLQSGVTVAPQIFTLSPQHPSQVITITTAAGAGDFEGQPYNSFDFRGTAPNTSLGSQDAYVAFSVP